MTTLKILLTLLCFPFVLVSQTYDSKINNVTIFMQGAQLERTSTLKIQKGIATVTLKNLSRFIDANSIQAKIPGVKILNVSYKLDYLSDEEQNLDKKKLEIALDDLDYKLKTIDNKKLSTEQELKLIQQNVDIKGQAVLDVADLEDFLIFYRSNLPLIRTSLLNLEVEKKQVEQQIQKVKQELGELNTTQQKVSGTVNIDISSEKIATENLALSYFVRNAGWSPFYNLRTKGVGEAIEMEFNANVYQNTGVEWNNVNLTLATGNPQVSGNAPQLHNWYVDYYREQNVIRGNIRAKSAEYKTIQYEAAPMAASADNFEPAISSENLTFQEYKIASPYNISSNGKQQRVEIQKHQLPAEYNYFTVPKLDSKAYLIAKVSDWEQYKLLSGNSKIYFEDTYVGEAFIDANNTNDTLTLSLGEDKNVIVERKNTFDKSKGTFIGGRDIKKKSFEITVRNTKSKAIKIEVLDQIPLSKNNDIKVKLNEFSGAIYNEITGELKWVLELNSNEKTTKTFEFEISYPKNQKISL